MSESHALATPSSLGSPSSDAPTDTHTWEDHLATGHNLIEQFWTEGDRDALADAVSEYRLALRQALDDPSAKIQAKIALADALRLQIEEGKAHEDNFREALALTEEARKDASAPSALYCESLRAHGEVLSRRFYPRDPDFCQRAADTLCELVDLTTNMSPEVQVKSLVLYAWAIDDQYTVSADPKQNDLANRLVDRASEFVVSSEGHAHKLMHALALARFWRFALTHNTDDICEAISAVDRLIAGGSPRHPRLWTYWGLRGACYHAKWRLTGSSDDQDSVISSYEEAVKRVPSDHPTWTTCLGNYAAALDDRFTSRSNLEDLDEAVRISRAVVEHILSATRWPAHGHTYLANHIEILLNLYEQSGNWELVDEAVGLPLDILESAPPVYRFAVLESLSKAYFARYITHGRRGDLESAIKMQEQAVTSPDVFGFRIGGRYRLGVYLMARFQLSDNQSDLEHAILELETALTNPDMEFRAQMYSLLGTALLHRSTTGRPDKYIAEAIRAQQQALELLPDEHTERFTCFYRLGLAKRKAFELQGGMEALYDSVDAYTRALATMPRDHSNRAMYLLDMARSQFAVAYAERQDGITHVLTTLHEAANHTPSWPGDRYLAAVEAARLAHRSGIPALHTYRQAISILPEVAWIGLEDELRMERLAKQPIDVSQDAAACAIEEGRYEEALEILEGSRSIVWNTGQELRMDLARLRERAPDLARELAETNAALAFRRPGAVEDETDKEREVERRRIRHLASRRTELIQKVRAISGFELFLLPPSYDNLREAARHGSVIVLNASVYRCDAIVLRPGQPITLIPLTDVSHDQLKQDVLFLQKSLQPAKDRRGAQFLEAELLRLLRRIWNTIGRPICNGLFENGKVHWSSQLNHRSKSSYELSEARRVWWCPTGLMSFLPLHACGPHNGVDADIFDLVVSSYTPTLSALVRSRRVSSAEFESSFAPLIICQPDIPGHAPLPTALQELAVIGEIFQWAGSYLVGPAGRISIAEHLLPTHSWLHVISHGRQDGRNPLESSIALYDGPLKLSRIAQARLPNAEFAFLSACHSARGAGLLPDEAMHLAAGLLFAGYKSVVGTSWGIADKDAPCVARSFYGYLTRDGRTPDVSETADALHVAVQLLRRSGVPAYRWVPFLHLGA